MSEDVKNIVEKIRIVTEQGDQCCGLIYGKRFEEWTDIFNQAAAELGMDLIKIDALRGGRPVEVSAHTTKLFEAFEKAADKPAIILADTSGNGYIGDRHMAYAVSDFTLRLSQKFPKAIFVQSVPVPSRTDTSSFYCMNPKTPRDPSQPIYPV